MVRTRSAWGGLVAAAALAAGGFAAAPASAAAAARPATVTAHTASHNPLLNYVLAYGEDDETDSASLSALCQSYAGDTHVYHSIAPNVDAINGDSVVSVGSQTGCYAAQNETTVAVNPENPRNLVAGANDYRVFNSRESRNDSSGWAYTSFDGGKTWKNVVLPHLTYQTGATGALSDMDSAGDPVVAFGPHNTVYYANIVFSRLNSGSGIAVSVSHDGGFTWGEPSIVQLDGVTADGTPTSTNYFNDKEWIAVDQHTGQVYLTWTRFTYDSSGNYVESPITLKTSDNQGRSWSPAYRVSPTTTNFSGGLTAFAQGSNPKVTADGTLYVAYEGTVCATLACNGTSDHDETVVAVSHNHGKTWANEMVGANYDYPYNADVQNETLTGENFRINSYPQLTVDPVTQRLYVTWSDDRNGEYTSAGVSVKTDGTAFISSSADGRDWSPVTAAEPGGDVVFPAVAAFGGKIAVTYYTRSYDPSGIDLDYAYTTIGWNGQHSAQHRVTTQSADPQVQFVSTGAVSGQVLQGVFIGDYSAAVIGADGQLHPVWTDFRGEPGVDTPHQTVDTQSFPLYGW
ncbi:exo-alpha-sialidase [Actinospica sp. MGRD01-02]|uniref:Exo-alpha-sialidase n=1 Tax=Actinospica acidithermotolerans TaxID=2828514 RepID=A0A941ILK7_9ACTN|nr:sialidase family protein [Actinospica acidithermotolerans]MBR7830112.1 exo-alpha-sialidase [Actinospica acidithermotolerans]